MGLLDFIFPKYCVNCKKFGDYLCANCFSHLSFDTKNICLVCGSPSYDGKTHPNCRKRNSPEGVFTGVVFNKISKKLIYQFKYRPYLFGLSVFIADLLYDSLIQDEEFAKVSNLPLVLVPVPLSSRKFKKRGYNQAEILAKELGKRLNIKVIDCLERTRETITQVGLGKKERRENIKDAFIVKKKYEESLKNMNILIVDDVLTTGATIYEATMVLKKSGSSKVWGVAFARE
ncbi:MAG: ComF family protein [Candidatus Levybacteria bacterium]|nr:ComF family protein [Candidatus Levybacteria bacterium]